jgi:hypothetical protein
VALRLVVAVAVVQVPQVILLQPITVVTEAQAFLRALQVRLLVEAEAEAVGLTGVALAVLARMAVLVGVISSPMPQPQLQTPAEAVGVDGSQALVPVRLVSLF